MYVTGVKQHSTIVKAIIVCVHLFIVFRKIATVVEFCCHIFCIILRFDIKE